MVMTSQLPLQTGLPTVPHHSAPAPVIRVPAEEAAPPIKHLRKSLEAAFNAEKQRGHVIGINQPPESAARLDKKVREAVQGYIAAGHQDWKEFLSFNEHHYVRHLICECDDFEMMVICWRYSQGSRVHNHGQSHCWMSVLQGCVQELQYTAADAADAGEVQSSPREVTPPQLPGVLSTVSPCPLLEHIGTNELRVGETGYINDHIALHAVRCPEHCTGIGAATLHVYAPPIRRVKLYEPDNDRVVQRIPGFFTQPDDRQRQPPPSLSPMLASPQGKAVPLMTGVPWGSCRTQV